MGNTEAPLCSQLLAVGVLAFLVMDGKSILPPMSTAVPTLLGTLVAAFRLAASIRIDQLDASIVRMNLAV